MFPCPVNQYDSSGLPTILFDCIGYHFNDSQQVGGLDMTNTQRPNIVSQGRHDQSISLRISLTSTAAQEGSVQICKTLNQNQNACASYTKCFQPLQRYKRIKANRCNSKNDAYSCAIIDSGNCIPESLTNLGNVVRRRTSATSAFLRNSSPSLWPDVRCVQTKQKLVW